jgi:hypothetical protein
MPRLTLATLIFACLTASPARADDPDAIARGKKALEGRAFSPAPWPFSAYENVWKHWQPKLDKSPENYDQAFREHYGLPEAPYENGRYPMGIRPGELFFIKGLTTDCMMCHGSSILGKSYVGLGNSSLEIQALFEDLNLASGRAARLPHIFSNVRGTSEAGAMAVFLHSFRNPDLSLRLTDRHKWELRDNLCEDVPAWWLLKKKKSMYHVGNANSRSVRSIMQFMLTPNNSLAVFEKEEAAFRDIQAYILSLEPPKYPFAIDMKLADAGHKIFTKTCSQCHGTYGPDWTYPNKIVPLKTIGTDTTRYYGIPRELGEFYNTSWFAKEKLEGALSKETAGYQAPPLDGIWATAPYFHNGSVPTLYDVLNSKTRPKLFTRSFKTGEPDYDKIKIGWKVQVLETSPKTGNAYERRRIYDTTQPGRGNMGHTFGDELTDDERRAVVEYLKTL